MYSVKLWQSPRRRRRRNKSAEQQRDWFRLQGTGTGLVPTTDRKGLVPQPKARAGSRGFCVADKIVFFFFGETNSKWQKTVFCFWGVDFSVAKILTSYGVIHNTLSLSLSLSPSTNNYYG
jgi:hypothetical protein